MAKNFFDKRIFNITNMLVYGTLAFLLLILRQKYFPTTTGQSHIGNAIILRDLLTGDCPNYADFFQINYFPIPGWFSYIALSLLTIAASPAWAEKFLVAAYVPLFIFSFDYFVRSFAKNRWPSLFSLALVINAPLLSGNYNYCFSLCFLILAISYWYRHRGNINIAQGLALLALFTLTYFCDLTTFLLEFLSIAIIATCELCIREKNNKSRKNTSTISLEKLFYAFLAFLPGLILVILYLSTGTRDVADSVNDLNSIPNRLWQLVTPKNLVPWSQAELVETQIFVFAAYVIYLAGLGYKLYLRNFDRFDIFFILPPVILLIAVFMPVSIIGGGTLATSRLMLVAIIIIIAHAARFDLPKNIRLVLCSIAISLFVIMLAYNLNFIRRYQPVIENFEGLEAQLAPNSNIVVIDVSGNQYFPDKNWHGQSIFIKPIKHLATSLALDECMLDLGNYEAARDNIFPLQFNDKLNPKTNLFPKIRPTSEKIIEPNYKRYESISGKRVDYIIIWGNPVNRSPAFKNSLTQFVSKISRDYALQPSFQNRANMYKVYAYKGKNKPQQLEPGILNLLK